MTVRFGFIGFPNTGINGGYQDAMPLPSNKQYKYKYVAVSQDRTMRYYATNGDYNFKQFMYNKAKKDNLSLDVFQDVVITKEFKGDSGKTYKEIDASNIIGQKKGLKNGKLLAK